MPRHARGVPSSSKPSRRARKAHDLARKEFVTYDTSYIRPKKSKAPVIIASIIAALVVIIACILIVPKVFGGSNEGSLSSNEQATIVIESGDNAATVAGHFKDANLVADAGAFASELDKCGAANNLVPGSYTFNGQTPTSEMADRLKKGEKDSTPKVTVVEGYTVKATAEALDAASSGQIKAADFETECADASRYASSYSFLKDVGTNSLEGFLFPKTYEIEQNDNAASMVQKMLNQFQKETEGIDFSYPTSKGLSIYEAINLASIVQKESPSDLHARVAGVFYNRLSSDSPYLQSDATTAYKVGHDPTAEEVHADDPYSTYSNPGLPPTPICNPSLDSIKAVCNPEQTDYLFFYTNDDGSYSFSKTYDEHKDAIKKDTQ